MNPRTIAGVLAVLSIAFACPPAARAHHSSAMYDRKQLVTLRGVVKEFRWTNPHTTIRVDVDGSRGQVPGICHAPAGRGRACASASEWKSSLPRCGTADMGPTVRA
jgi:Family of unknown function (DUF6152)